MITFKAIVISNNRRKDGTYPVKIRVTFKGVSRRLPTTLVCQPGDLTRSLRIKSADILNKTDALIGTMRDAAAGLSPFDLEAKDVDWVVAKIRSKLSADSFKLDFFSWADEFIKTKAPSTRVQYSSAVHSLEIFLGTRTLDINSITKPMVISFADWVESAPKLYRDKDGNIKESKVAKRPGCTAPRHISMLSHIFQAAKRKYNDDDSGVLVIPRSPFDDLDIRFRPSVRHRSIGQDTMQLLISDATPDAYLRTALDLFVVSFGLMGANLVDLWRATPQDKVWIYRRAKTESRREDGAEMRVYIPEEIKPYLARLGAGTSAAWWIPAIHAWKDNNCATRNINQRLAAWCESEDLENMTFYAARHTWATLARKAGVEKATIDECLAHKGDFSLTDIYAERNWDLINAANRKVLSLFEWPGFTPDE